MRKEMSGGAIVGVSNGTSLNMCDDDSCCDKDEERVDEDGFPLRLSHRKDKGLRSWLVVLGCFFGQCIAVGGFYSIGIFIVPFVDDFGLSSRAPAAAIGSFCAVGFLGFGPFAGRIADRMGSRKCILIGTGIASSAYLVSSFMNNIYALWCTYGIITGLGGSFLYYTSAPLPSHWFIKRRGIATGVAISGGGLGNVIFPLILSPIIEAYSWRWALRAMSVFALCLGLLCALLVERRIPLKKGQGRIFSLDISLLRGHQGYGMRRLCCAYAIFQLAFFAPLFHIPPYVEIDANHGASNAALVLTFMGIGNLFGRFFLGVMADRYSSVGVGACANMITAVSSAGWPAYKALWLICFYGWIFGAFGSALWSLAPIIAGELVPLDKLGAALGLALGPLMLPGCLISAPVAGILRKNHGHYWAAAIWVALCMCFSAYFMYTVHGGQSLVARKKKKENNNNNSAIELAIA